MLYLDFPSLFLDSLNISRLISSIILLLNRQIQIRLLAWLKFPLIDMRGLVTPLHNIHEPANKRGAILGHTGLTIPPHMSHLIPMFLRSLNNRDRSSRLFFVQMIVHFDSPLNIINNGIDLMFAEVGHAIFRWSQVVRPKNHIALTHQIYQFGMIISILLPHIVDYNFVKYIQP